MVSKKKIIITGGSGFIGTNLVEYFLKKDFQVLNLDKNPPRNKEYASNWINLDILNVDKTIKAFLEFDPDYVLHFAARTDLNEKDNLDGYAANIDGVINIIEAIRQCKKVKRVIFASSQLVCKIGYQPKDEFDVCPNTLYGRSKVLTEKIIRNAGEFDSEWVIVRPTSFWGPWFDIPYKNFFLIIKKNFYVHPGNIDTYKQWGYVGNAVYQIDKLLEVSKEKIHKKTFYLADFEPILLKDFANLVQKEFKVRPIPEIPYPILKLIARCGDFFLKLGWDSVPLSSFRLNNIISDEIQDLLLLKKIIGELPYNIQDGVKNTVAWMKEYGK